MYWADDGFNLKSDMPASWRCSWLEHISSVLCWCYVCYLMGLPQYTVFKVYPGMNIDIVARTFDYYSCCFMSLKFPVVFWCGLSNKEQKYLFSKPAVVKNSPSSRLDTPDACAAWVVLLTCSSGEAAALFHLEGQWRQSRLSADKRSWQQPVDSHIPHHASVPLQFNVCICIIRKRWREENTLTRWGPSRHHIHDYYRFIYWWKKTSLTKIPGKWHFARVTANCCERVLLLAS